MTIREAVDGRVQRVRLPEWSPGAYLELPLLPDGGCGPWVTLHDPNVDPQTQSLLITEVMRGSESRYEQVTNG